MVNKEALRSPPEIIAFEALADTITADRPFNSGDTQFSERSHATETSAAFTATRIMTVPDRIVLAGSEQHYELPGRPRELELDDQIYNNWSPSRVPISIQTPPRRLTLHDHSFPTADSEEYEEDYAGRNNQTQPGQQQQYNGVVGGQSAGMPEDDSDQQFVYYQGSTPSATPKGLRDRPQFRTSAQQTSQPNSKPLSTKGIAEKRFVDLYRRIEVLEKDNRQRRYREIIVYAGFLGYFVYRSFSYMFSRSRPY